jgi:hypothetical protein
MKQVFFASAILVATTLAHAGVDATTNSSATTNSTAGANNAGNAQSLNTTINSTTNAAGDTTSTLRTTPTVYAPPLAGSFSQANCMMSASGGVSLIGFGATGGAPVDGLRCDWRLDQQSLQASAMTITSFARTDGVDVGTRSALMAKAAKMLDAASDMSCLTSDRQREVLEKQGLCASVTDVATLDHRFGQPRSTQIDYSDKR